MHILAIQKGALGNGTVRKADAISSSCALGRLCILAIERGIIELPDAEATAAIDDGRKSARAEKLKLRQAGSSSSMPWAIRDMRSTTESAERTRQAISR
jgi:hypothetical protein